LYELVGRNVQHRCRVCIGESFDEAQDERDAVHVVEVRDDLVQVVSRRRA
jgi:hypothetical protein